MSTKDRFGSCNQPHANNSLWDGPGFSRRQFFGVAGTALTGYYFTQVTRPLDLKAAGKVATRGTARNCIFIFLTGAPSHIDTFDLKEGSWTPADFNPTSYGDIRFPQGLMPKLAERLNWLTIVRSVQSWAAVHSLAQTWTQIARNPTSALGRIAPNLGAVVALEKEKQGARLPGFIAMNTGNPVGAGYLPSRLSPFVVAPNQTGLAQVAHPDGQPRFDTRLQLLASLDGALRMNAPFGREAENMSAYYEQARGLMYNPTIDAVFRFTNEERWRYGDYPAGDGPNAGNRYGTNAFGDACIVARNILKADMGTRFIQIAFGGWDHHQNIYSQAQLYGRTRTLDGGLAALLEDLAQTPGVGGGSLFDETLIVMMGEFGRTVGRETQSLNNQAGRDHYLQQFVVFAGGGTKGGRVIGATNNMGAFTVESGWERNRPVRVEDIAATIYTALGIDWTTVRYDDPFNRGFEYVPDADDDVYGPINAVFG